MAAKDHTDLDQRLRQRLSELEHRLNSIKKDVTQPHASDWSEQAQERENDEVIDAIGNETSIAIAQIAAALERIKEGDYGLCTRCGEAISEARLAIIPETPTCVKCSA